MKVWRLHLKGNLAAGPYRGRGRNLVCELIGHNTPQLHMDDLADQGQFDEAYALRVAFERARREGWMFGWDSEAKMKAYAEDSAYWPDILLDFEVSVLEVRDFHVMPDGQVMFDRTGAWDTGEPFLLYS